MKDTVMLKREFIRKRLESYKAFPSNQTTLAISNKFALSVSTEIYLEDFSTNPVDNLSSRFWALYRVYNYLKDERHDGIVISCYHLIVGICTKEGLNVESITSHHDPDSEIFDKAMPEWAITCEDDEEDDEDEKEDDEEEEDEEEDAKTLVDVLYNFRENLSKSDAESINSDSWDKLFALARKCDEA